MLRPKLRDNKNKRYLELYPLGQIPNDIIYNISKNMIYNFAMGKKDISGEDWGDIFAKSIDGGIHLGKPVGLADVVLDNMAWSVKSVKSNDPNRCRKIRLISGRNSPDFSYGVSDPHEDIQYTGDMVLSIWNERVNIAKEKYEPLRTIVLVRNFEMLEFTIFEHETVRYNIKDYEWKENSKGNLEGFDKINSKHRFTWQPHGAQFTIIYDIPSSAIKFKIKKPPILDFDGIISQIGFNESWVNIISR